MLLTARWLVPRGLAVLTAVLLSSAAHAADWLQWGGPGGDFMIQSGTLASSWPEGGPKRLWQRELGKGYSSILRKGDRLVTMYRSAQEEIIVAMDARTGSTLWEHRDTPQLWPDMRQDFGLGPNGTPLIIGDRVVAIGISGQMRCLSLDKGALLWKKDLAGEFKRTKRVEEYGYSGSPLPYRDTIIALAGGSVAAVVALNPADGSVLWKSEPGGVSYAHPTITKMAGRDQFIYFEPEGVAGLDPATGKTLWKSPIEFDNGNHLTPAVKCDDEHLWIGSQFPTGGGRLLRITAKGDNMSVQQLWFTARLRASHWPLIRIGDLIYGSIGGNDVSTVSAFQWKTGEVVWSERGFHKAQALWADGRLLFLDETGKLVLAKVTPSRLEVLAKAQMTVSPSWTLPTLVDTTLYLRDEKKILALDLAGPH